MSEVRWQVLSEREACARFLRAEADKLQPQYDAGVPKSHTRARLLGAMDALRGAAKSIEAGEEEPFFGDQTTGG